MFIVIDNHFHLCYSVITLIVLLSISPRSNLEKWGEIFEAAQSLGRFFFAIKKVSLGTPLCDENRLIICR